MDPRAGMDSLGEEKQSLALVEIREQRGYCANIFFNPLNAELNPICHLLALLGAHHIFHVSGLRVNFRCYGNKQ